MSPSDAAQGIDGAPPGKMITISGAPVCKVGMGTWGLGGVYRIGGRSAGIPGLERSDPYGILTHALDGGINLLDCSATYGRAEEIVGSCVARRRKDVFIAAKCGLRRDGRRDYGFGTLCRSLETSMRRLKTDVVDLFQISLGPLDEVDEALEGLHRLRNRYAIRYVGLSTANAAQVGKAIRSRSCDAVQVVFNLLDTRCWQAASAAAKAAMFVLVKSPLNKGVLSASNLSGLPREDSRRLYLTPSVVERRRKAARMTLAGAGLGQERLEDIAVGFAMAAPFATAVLFGVRRREHADRLFHHKRRKHISKSKFTALLNAARLHWPEVAETFPD